MIFSSFAFIFAFLPCVWIVFHVLKAKHLNTAKIFLIFSSLFFYAYWKLSYLPILLSSIAVNYILTFCILSPKIFNSKIYFIFGIVFNLCLLGFFKYTNFVLENFNLLLSTPIEFEKILLPLALSFVTFQQIAFLRDCYLKSQGKNTEVNLNFIDYALFISFFPQLIAGPIVHHKEMMPQFSHLKGGILWDSFAKGIFIFVIGLFKKVIIADRFANYANPGFQYAESGNLLNMSEAWGTSFSYTFQLYFDFSGYCDMAIGLGLMFGIMLPINFNSPYQALNITEFWRRWHMTLGRFFKECLYIPLGGNQKNKIITCRNLFIVAFLSGIWHGAGWGFIIWGIMHGTAMIIHRIYSWNFQTIIQKNQNRFFYKVCAWLITLNFVNVAWIFFRAENVNAAFLIIQSMLGFGVETSHKWHHIFEHLHAAPNPFLIFLIGIIFLCVLFKNSIFKLKKFKPHYVYLCFSIVLFLWSLRNLGLQILEQNTYSPFIYFNF